MKSVVVLSSVLMVGCAGALKSDTYSLTRPPNPPSLVKIDDGIVMLYPCRAIHVTDGDTYWLVCRTMDRGRYGETLVRMIVRTTYSTPEVRGPVSIAEKERGLKATAFVIRKLKPMEFIVGRTRFNLRVQILNQGNFGRPLAQRVLYWDPSCSNVSNGKTGCYRDLEIELDNAGHTE